MVIIVMVQQIILHYLPHRHTHDVEINHHIFLIIHLLVNNIQLLLIMFHMQICLQLLMVQHKLILLIFNLIR